MPFVVTTSLRSAAKRGRTAFRQLVSVLKRSVHLRSLAKSGQTSRRWRNDENGGLCRLRFEETCIQRAAMESYTLPLGVSLCVCLCGGVASLRQTNLLSQLCCCLIGRQPKGGYSRKDMQGAPSTAPPPVFDCMAALLSLHLLEALKQS